MIKAIQNLTPIQLLLILLSVNSAIAGSTAQLNDLFGPQVAHYIVSIFTFANTIIGAFMVPFTGQSAQIAQVAAMPGVEHISVNSKASRTLAQAAVSADPALAKIEPIPTAEAAVTRTASAA